MPFGGLHAVLDDEPPAVMAGSKEEPKQVDAVRMPLQELAAKAANGTACTVERIRLMELLAQGYENPSSLSGYGRDFWSNFQRWALAGSPSRLKRAADVWESRYHSVAQNNISRL